MEENAEELAQIESRNVGKPISGARGEVGNAAAFVVDGGITAAYVTPE